jgi:hypothetical protein
MARRKHSTRTVIELGYGERFVVQPRAAKFSIWPEERPLDATVKDERLAS